MILPTASQLPRVVACPSSHVLPHVYEPSSPAAEAGTARHSRIADVLMGRAPRESIEWPVHEVLGIADGDTVWVERAFRLYLDDGSVRHCGDEIGRNYPPPEDRPYIDGTVDAAVLHAPHGITVCDWKGRSGAVAAGSNWQVRFAAYCVQRSSGRDGVMTAAIVALDGDDYTIESTATLGADDHADALAIFRLMRDVIAANAASLGAGNDPRTLPVNAGEHCCYCPARHGGGCSVYDGAAVSLANAIDGPPIVQAVNADLATPEGIGKWYEWSARAAEVLKMIDGAVRTALETGPGVLPDGRTVKLISYEQRKLDGRIALRVLRERYGDAADEAATVAIGAAEKIAKAAAGKGLGAAEVRALTAALADAGAIGAETRTKIVTDKAKPCPDDAADGAQS